MKRPLYVLLATLVVMLTGGWLYVGTRGLNVVIAPPPPGTIRVLNSGDPREIEDTTLNTQRRLETDVPNNPGTTIKAADRHTTVVTGWTNPANAYAVVANSVYATAAPAKNTTVSGDFGFPALTAGELPVGSTITAVTMETVWKVSTQASAQTFGIRIYNGTTALGTETVDTTEPLANTTRTVAVLTGITEANLKTAGQIKARVRATRGSSNTAVTCYVDYVKMTVDYLY